jgi:hypothetical protein
MMDKIVDAVDEWFHRRGFGLIQAQGKRATVTPWWGWLVKPLCDYRERRYLGQDWVEFYSNPENGTSSNSYTTIRWNVKRSHRD